MQSSETPAVGPTDVPPTLTRRAEIPFLTNRRNSAVRDIDTIMPHKPGEITLVPTGALTNIAFAVRHAPLDVELTGTLTAGMTVADFRAPASEGCTTQVAVDLEHEKFWSLIIDALERIGDQE